MATDFFDRQDDARRRTGWLVFYFAIAVILIIASVYAAFTGILVMANPDKDGPPPALFDIARLVAVSTITGIVILLGSLYKIVALREGGGAVARSLGGRLVEGNTRDMAERRLLNVVEEMALASGTPVPPVYILDDEPGINAFAAGHTPTDAAIGVTRGTIDHLTRDQLQGVIAHEFSHILNGDMRLDIKLMGTLHGILLLALLGQIFMRMAGNSGSRSSSRSDSDKKDNGAMMFFLAGLALFIIGYLGVFFGRLIKSAVSRQREFLADASAVQFTRNPDGIAGALKKIGGLNEGGRIRSPEAEEACHIFFGAAVPSMSSLMATHPPLEERIKRIDPQFDGVFPEVRDDEHVELSETPAKKKPKNPGGIGGLGAVLPGVNIPGNLGGAVLLPAAGAVSTVGSPRPEHVAYASNLASNLPQALIDASREPYGAVALIYALLFDRDPQILERQIASLRQLGAPGHADTTLGLVPDVQSLGEAARLPLVDLAIPALRNLSLEQYDQFRMNIPPLIQADNVTTLFEYALERTLFRNLDRQYRRIPPPPVRFNSIEPVGRNAMLLLGSIAWVDHRDQSEIDSAYDAGVEKLGLPEGSASSLPPREMCTLGAVDAALTAIATSSPQVKKRVLEACAATISADGKVTVAEGELLRAIADSLDCPMPPLLAA